MDHSRSDFGVIFDVDGVLVDSADAHLRSWQRLAEENGRTVTAEQFSTTFGRHNDDIVPILFGAVTAVRLRELAERKEQIYRELIQHDVPLVTGARELVLELHRAGLRLAIGSSSPRANIRLVLEALSSERLFSAIVTAERVTRGKPDPQVFQLACSDLGLPPKHCVVIEDAPAGVTAARAAGAGAIAVLRHHDRAAFPHAHLIVERLDELSAQTILELVGRTAAD